MAVENARFGIDQTRANLEVAREAYNQATAKLLEQQKQIGETIAHLTSLSLTNAGIKAMLPVLKKAVGAFTSTSTVQNWSLYVCCAQTSLS